jgi:hypothetical protein
LASLSIFSGVFPRGFRNRSLQDSAEYLKGQDVFFEKHVPDFKGEYLPICGGDD